MACKVGSANPDIAGLGASHFSSPFGHYALTVLDQPQAGEDDTQVSVPLKKKCIDKILATIGDVQIINAMGLLIAAFIQHETLSLYHLRVVYDIANFTAVSACASLINVSADANNPKRTRILVFSVYTLLFLPFCAFLGTKLKNWDEKVPGRCYNTGLTASPDSMHPLAGMIYLGITCFWSITALVCCFNSKLDPYRSTTFPTESLQRGVEQLKTYMLDSLLRDIQSINQTRGGDYAGFFHWNPIFLVPQCFFTFLYLLFHPKAEYQVWALLPLAMAQYPLHLYMVIAIRIRNERFLEGDSENDWGFGQIIALVLCAATCIECIRGVSDKRATEIEVTNLLRAYGLNDFTFHWDNLYPAF
ncbi:hypothetical protein CDV36_014540 [Fusarium kuroshium]|uniref:Uncharacterized protein n=1 Tax=Fusarium kuroshium TaxID=2010991 RepID=A0A3M2RI15_9HYPO|nr:hypothetical protein CDV36_014540 [Fusarium kuroshium]